MKLAPRIAIVASVLLVVGFAVAPVLAANADVAIAGKAFEPSTITISPGRHGHLDRHRVDRRAAFGDVRNARGFRQDLRLWDRGERQQLQAPRRRRRPHEHTFNEAGEFIYYCVVHPADMTGKVVVLAPGASPPPASSRPLPRSTRAISGERKLLAGGILVVALVLMFGMAWVWRRMNPA